MDWKRLEINILQYVKKTSLFLKGNMQELSWILSVTSCEHTTFINFKLINNTISLFLVLIFSSTWCLTWNDELNEYTPETALLNKLIWRGHFMYFGVFHYLQCVSYVTSVPGTPRIQVGPNLQVKAEQDEFSMFIFLAVSSKPGKHSQ